MKREWRVLLMGSLRSLNALTSRRLEKLTCRRATFFFDPLALPISTGIEEDRRNALETIEGIRRIKKELARLFHDSWRFQYFLLVSIRRLVVVLNSVFLHDAVEAGLDAAIVNASKIEPVESNRRERAERWRVI